jgi:sortase B
MEEKKKVNRKKILYYSLLGLFSLVFICSAIYIGSYLWGSYQAKSDYDDLADIRDQYLEQQPTTQPVTTDPPETTVSPETTVAPEATTQPPAGTDDPTEPPVTTEPGEPTILPELEQLYEMNNDLVGWICIPNTKLNYPVLQTPNDANYYLYRDFYKNNSRWGAIYANELCNINAPSDNVTLYGHNMKDNSMFGILDNYQRKSYWEEHSTFTFDTLYERRTYKIFAVFRTTAIAESGFQYHNFIDASSEKEFNKFISRIKRLDYYDTGITPVYGDKIVCLSTCEYTQAHGRFVVCGVLIEEE